MKTRLLLVAAALLSACGLLSAQTLPPAAQAKLDEEIKVLSGWAADPVILNAVKAHNAGLPPEQASITQDQWRSFTVLDPVVRAFTKNEVGQFLKANKGKHISEAFVSGADGLKVGFIAKTTNWSHKGKPKHDVPMSGKTWQGPIEIDESSGERQIQIAVPVLDGGKPIGSLVVGYRLTKFSE